MPVPAHSDFGGFDSAFGSGYNALDQKNVAAADWSRARGDGGPKIAHYQLGGAFRQNVPNPVYLDPHSYNRNTDPEVYEGENALGEKWTSAPEMQIPTSIAAAGADVVFAQAPQPPTSPSANGGEAKPASEKENKCLVSKENFSWSNFLPCMGSAIQGTLTELFEQPAENAHWYTPFVKDDRPFYLSASLLSILIVAILIWALVRMGRR